MIILRCASVLLLGACLSGCSHTAGNGFRKNPPIAVGPKDTLFVAAPFVSDSVDTLLGRIGWGEGRFSSELQKEILFQSNRLGVATVEDSAKANSALTVSVTGYVQGSGSTSRFVVSARLRTRVGERAIEIKKSPARSDALERQDPTIDNLRFIASTLANAAKNDPDAKKKEPQSDHVPTVMILF